MTREEQKENEFYGLKKAIEAVEQAFVNKVINTINPKTSWDP